MQSPQRVLLTGLLPLTYSACFLMEPRRLTSPGTAPNTMNSGIPHDHKLRNCLTAESHGSISSMEAPFSVITPTCVKLTNKASHYTHFDVYMCLKSHSHCFILPSECTCTHVWTGLLFSLHVPGLIHHCPPLLSALTCPLPNSAPCNYLHAHAHCLILLSALTCNHMPTAYLCSLQVFVPT
jgi:hypothetical protein